MPSFIDDLDPLQILGKRLNMFTGLRYITLFCGGFDITSDFCDGRESGLTSQYRL
jgi:hypothetical protein